MMICTSKGRF